MNKLAPVVGYGTLYAAYMKNGGFDPVLDKLTGIWIKKADTLPGPQKPPSVKGVIDPAKARTQLQSKFKNNFPPKDVMLKFWDTVFFA
jgi:hypothetical protein